jgi:hypothetical protein
MEDKADRWETAIGPPVRHGRRGGGLDTPGLSPTSRPSSSEGPAASTEGSGGDGRQACAGFDDILMAKYGGSQLGRQVQTSGWGTYKSLTMASRQQNEYGSFSLSVATTMGGNLLGPGDPGVWRVVS